MLFDLEETKQSFYFAEEQQMLCDVQAVCGGGGGGGAGAVFSIRNQLGAVRRACKPPSSQQEPLDGTELGGNEKTFSRYH